MNQKKKKIIICLLLTLAPLAGLLLLELVLRLLWPQPPRGFSKSLFVSNHGLNKVKPGAKGRQYSREFDVSVAGNAIGYRDIPGFNASITPNIILLGDSYCFGWGVEARDTASARIAQTEEINVYNLGIPGDGVYTQIQRLNELNIPKCKAIILLFFDNDLSDEIRLNRSTSSKPEKSTGEQQARHQPPGKSLRSLLLENHVVRLSGRIIDFCGLSDVAANMTGSRELMAKAYGEVMEAHRESFYKSELWHQLQSQYTKLYTKAKEMADQVIVIRIVAPFVTKYPISKASDYDISLCDKEMQALARKNGVEYYSYSPADSEKLFFKFDQHLNATGHRALADYIISKMRLNQVNKVALPQ